MQVHTNVPEADIGRLRSGMQATFTVDAYPDQRFQGLVQTVRNASQVSQNVVTYDAVLEVDNTSLKLRPGMTATVTFIVAEASGVLTVPLAAFRFQPSSRNLERGAPSSSDDDSEKIPSASGFPKAKVGEARNDQARANMFSGSDHRTIYILTERRPRAVEVNVGLSDGTTAEISGPLQLGDAVIVGERDKGVPGPKKAPRLPRSP